MFSNLAQLSHSLLLLLVILLTVNPVKAQSSDPIKFVQNLLAQPSKQLDLAKTKLEIDQLIDPSINIKQSLNQIDAMVNVIKSALPANSSSIERLQALRTYLYDTGYWNNHQAFSYDFDDPMGTNINNKLLSIYLKSKKGNCFSMPFLFVIMAQKLGLEATISTAPLHVFVKYKDPTTNQWIGLETTNTAEFADDNFYINQSPMTKAAITNGVYLQPLSKKETIAVMAIVLSEYYAQQQQWQRSIDIAQTVIKYYPKYAYAMLKVGNAYNMLLNEEIKLARAKGSLTPSKKIIMDLLYTQNIKWFKKAENLGWQPPPKSAEDQYLNNVRQRAQ